MQNKGGKAAYVPCRSFYSLGFFILATAVHAVRSNNESALML
jgi:hypothetical protein